MTLEELIQQREALDAMIAQTKEEELSGVLSQVRALITAYGLTQEQVFAKDRAKVPAKYRNPETGVTWSGRGIAPAWFDKTRSEDFRI